jgi:hypothetical protein
MKECALRNLEIFSLDDDVFAKPKKIRVKKIKRDTCGTLGRVQTTRTEHIM